MPTAILQAAEIALHKFVKGEIEAGLGFAAHAFENEATNPTNAATFFADAEDCYATATGLIGKVDSVQGWPLELGTMLDELRRRIDVLRETRMVFSAAA